MTWKHKLGSLMFAAALILPCAFAAMQQAAQIVS